MTTNETITLLAFEYVLSVLILIRLLHRSSALAALPDRKPDLKPFFMPPIIHYTRHELLRWTYEIFGSVNRNADIDVLIRNLLWFCHDHPNRIPTLPADLQRWYAETQKLKP